MFLFVCNLLFIRGDLVIDGILFYFFCSNVFWIKFIKEIVVYLFDGFRREIFVICMGVLLLIRFFLKLFCGGK